MVHTGTGSLPRNLAATLQDIEAKRQLALQQKGNHRTYYVGWLKGMWIDRAAFPSP